MPVADQSIIAPSRVDYKLPLKKSTVGWIALLLLALTVVGVFAPRLVGSVGDSKPPAPSERQPVTGRPADIDSEFEKMSKRAPPALPEEAPPSTPLPAPIEPVVDPTATAESKEAEIDAAGRSSKAIAYDASTVAAPKAAPSPLDQLRALAPRPPAAAAAEADGNLDRTEYLKLMLDAQKQANGAQTSGGDKAWLKELASAGSGATLRPQRNSGRYKLLQGKVIPAVLGRDLNTDLPGEVTACTTIDVYDSLSSDYLLIPKGSCLAGQYSSSIRSGQDRVMFAFTRLILPNGTSFNLPAAPGADLGGAAGIEGDVNTHFLQMFGSSLMVALLADRLERDASASQVSVGAQSSARTAAGEVLVDTSKNVLDRYRVIPPTIVVKKGVRINVEVTRDMEFDGPYPTWK